jgi:hypothetical protein
VAVSDVTFGLHLPSPFYNSDQRSGRFCSVMFSDPCAMEYIVDYIQTYWDLSEAALGDVVAYVQYGIGIYQSYMDMATVISSDLLQEDRPHANAKYIHQNAQKIAQEQLRMFVPTIFPTGLDFTINLTALAAWYRVAWSPTLQDITQKMVDCVLAEYPGLGFMFDGIKGKDSVVGGLSYDEITICTKPGCVVIRKDSHLESFAREVPHEKTFPLDLTPYDPWCMNLDVLEVVSDVEISVATMGQDQRHRTIRRNWPIFTGKFYVPPIVDELGIGDMGVELMERWFKLQNTVPHTLFLNLVPYGAMVRYRKVASLTALLHELQKRTCWCAQEEIYHLATKLLSELNDKYLAQYFAPPCFRTGRCGEGNRYCGRDLKRLRDNLYPKRRV